MTVYERVRALGEWSVQLQAGTPKSVRDLITPLTHVVVLPGRIYANRITDAAALASALYTGVVLRTPGHSLEIGGAGLSWWLGDSDDKGALLETAVLSGGASLSDWVNTIRPSSLAAGTITSPGGTLAGNYHWVTRRQALDSVCAAFGTEWRVNHNFTLDVAQSHILYGTTPVVIAMTDGGGSDTDLVGLEADVDVGYDYTDYASRVIVSGPAGRNAAGGVSTYRDGQGNLPYVYGLADTPDTSPGAEAAVAATLVALWSSEAWQRDLRISARRFAITRALAAGENLYIYDHSFGLVGTTPIHYQGRYVFPASVRIFGVRWPIEAPMSVLLRYYSGGSYVYADLSDYVVYESGSADLEVE